MTLFLFMMMLGVAVILFAATRMKAEANGSDKELEKTIQDFMEEFEQENTGLLQTIKQLQDDLRKETESNRHRIDQLETYIEQLAQKNKGKKQSKKQEMNPAIVFNEHYSRVVEMDREGRSLEQISKETGIGLGEIQTVLNLAKQGNPA